MRCQGDESVCCVQMGRHEIFIEDAANKGSACFDEILRRNKFGDDDAKDVLLSYTKRQALKGGRLEIKVWKIFHHCNI